MIKINKQRLWLIPVLLITFIIIYIVTDKTGIYPRCPIYTLFHIYCPGCGCTRAVRKLIHGNVYQAFRLNPLFLTLLPFLSLTVLNVLNIVTIDGKLLKYYIKFLYVVIILCIVFMLLRNTVYFSFLAPTIIER